MVIITSKKCLGSFYSADGAQIARMEAYMLFHEAGDKVIAVVVAGMAAQP